MAPINNPPLPNKLMIENMRINIPQVSFIGLLRSKRADTRTTVPEDRAATAIPTKIIDPKDLIPGNIPEREIIVAKIPPKMIRVPAISDRVKAVVGYRLFETTLLIFPIASIKLIMWNRNNGLLKPF
jgi:hypothetical protein